MAITVEKCRQIFLKVLIYHVVTMLVLLFTLVVSLFGLLESSSSLCEYDQSVIIFTKVFPSWLLAIQMIVSQEDPASKVTERYDDYPVDMFSKSALAGIGVWINTAFSIWAFLLANQISSKMTISTNTDCKVPFFKTIVYLIGTVANGLLLLTQLLVYLPSAISVIYTKIQAAYRAKRREKSLEYLGELYANIRNYDYPVEQVLRREWFVWEHEPLTVQEQAILLDVFRAEFDGYARGGCSDCAGVLEVGTLVVRHPVCGHLLHEACVGARQQCSLCRKNTRKALIAELRGTQNQSSIMQ